MEPDCSCSSDTSNESDDSPRRRRFQTRKQKGKVKRKAPGTRGRPRGRPTGKRVESDSTSSDSSDGTPPRERIYWERRSTPRRKTHTYAAMNCLGSSTKGEQNCSRSRTLSNRVSIGRRSLPEVQGVENYDVDLWCSDDEDFPPRYCQR